MAKLIEDLRFFIGAFFLIVGAILLVQGAMTPVAGDSVNLNLVTGGSFTVFAVIVLGLALNSARMDK